MISQPSVFDSNSYKITNSNNYINAIKDYSNVISNSNNCSIILMDKYQDNDPTTIEDNSTIKQASFSNCDMSESINKSMNEIEVIFNHIIPFKDLENFPKHLNIFSLIKNIEKIFQNFNDKNNNMSSYDYLNYILKSITNLRVLLKFHRVIFLNFFNSIFTSFTQIISNNTFNFQIIDNCLFLLNELFISYSNEFIYEKWIPVLLNLLINLYMIQQFITSKDFIEIILNNLIKYCYNVNNFTQNLNDLISENNYVKSKIAMNYLIKFLKFGNFSVDKIYPQLLYNKSYLLINSNINEFKLLGKELQDNLNKFIKIENEEEEI
jgi:hypothetical protein